MSFNQQSQKLVRIWGSIFLGMLLSFTSLLSFAQANYPNRPVRIIVPFSAGSGTDILARMVAERLTKSLGQSFVLPKLIKKIWDLNPIWSSVLFRLKIKFTNFEIKQDRYGPVSRLL